LAHLWVGVCCHTLLLPPRGRSASLVFGSLFISTRARRSPLTCPYPCTRTCTCITQSHCTHACRSNPDASFPILGDSLNGPCYVAFVGTTVRDWTSEPVNIFSQSQGQVSCQLVRVAAGVSIIQFTGSPPATGGCLMPSSYTVIIPSLTSRVGRTRRGSGTGRLHQQGGSDSPAGRG
jgi:hypothetical protein